MRTKQSTININYEYETNPNICSMHGRHEAMIGIVTILVVF